jgi:hypothetical protein
LLLFQISDFANLLRSLKIKLLIFFLCVLCAAALRPLWLNNYELASVFFPLLYKEGDRGRYKGRANLFLLTL